MVEMNKIGYARVSTNEQETDNQIKVLMEAGIPSDYIFTDKGVSGTIAADKRPGFQRLLAYINANRLTVKFIYVVEITRLGRNTLETLNVIDRLEKMGVMVWSLSEKEGFTRTEEKTNRQLFIMLMSWFSERERDNLVRRTKEGLDRARSEGKTLGRPRASIDMNCANQMRIDGLSWEEIAEKMGYPVMTLYRARKRKGMVTTIKTTKEIVPEVKTSYVELTYGNQ
jgi:DNA invertase Pin-like site-specific DNA recombinase